MIVIVIGVRMLNNFKMNLYILGLGLLMFFIMVYLNLVRFFLGMKVVWVLKKRGFGVVIRIDIVRIVSKIIFLCFNLWKGW